jgi:hypothetical protein
VAVLWIVEWDGISREQYEELSRRSGWEAGLPDGLQHQVTAFSDKALIITQVWKSPEHVMRFMEDRLLPVVRQMGINSMPRVDQLAVHSILTAE